MGFKTNVMQVQDIWIHFLTLAVCAASCGVAVYTLIRTYNSHSWQSISVLVSTTAGTFLCLTILKAAPLIGSMQPANKKHP